MPDSASASAGSLSFLILPRAQCGEGPRVALPGDHRLDDRAGSLVPGQLRHDGRQLALGFSELCKPSCKVGMSHQVTVAAWALKVRCG